MRTASNQFLTPKPFARIVKLDITRPCEGLIPSSSLGVSTIFMRNAQNSAYGKGVGATVEANIKTLGINGDWE